MTKEVIVEVLREGQIVKMPKSLARKEELFILRELHEEVKPIVQFPTYKTLNNARTSEQKWHSYQPHYLKNDLLKDLVDNFHWAIAKARKEQGLSRKRLADATGVSERELGELERGSLMSDNFISIAKIEDYLKIKLRKYPQAIIPPSETARPKPKYGANVSLSDLQRMKETTREPAKPIQQTSEVETF